MRRPRTCAEPCRLARSRAIASSNVTAQVFAGSKTSGARSPRWSAMNQITNQRNVMSTASQHADAGESWNPPTRAVGFSATRSKPVGHFAAGLTKLTTSAHDRLIRGAYGEDSWSLSPSPHVPTGEVGTGPSRSPSVAWSLHRRATRCGLHRDRQLGMKQTESAVVAKASALNAARTRGRGTASRSPASR